METDAERRPLASIRILNLKIGLRSVLELLLQLLDIINH